MSDNPRKPGRVFGQRDDNDKEPLGAQSRRPVEPAKPKGPAPNDPYPWARPDDESADPPKRDPNALDPSTPYPWADQPKEKPSSGQSGADPTAPYPWGDEGLRPKPSRQPGSGQEPVDPSTPYSWSEELRPPSAPRSDPAAPYPWSDDLKTPAAPPDEAAASPKVDDSRPRLFRPAAPPPIHTTTPPPPLSFPPSRPPAPQPEPELEDDPSELSWDELLADVENEEIEQAPAVTAPDVPAPEPAEAPRPKRFGFEPDEIKEAEPPAPLVNRVLKGTGEILNRPLRQRKIETKSYVEGDEGEESGPREIHLQYGLMARTAGTVVGLSVVIATLLTWWTPGNFLPPGSAEQLAMAAATPSAAATGPDPLNSIGIVSGHKGIHPATGLPDPGAVCADTGLTEQQVNEAVAVRVVTALEAQGYHVDLFDEFDKRLQGYHALVMVSIHADSCEYVNDEATGFKVASFAASANTVEDQRLTICLINRYAAATGLRMHPSVTYDMTDYHNFREIDARTPGAIIEIGFLYLDREYLTTHPDDVAKGISDGIMCYLRNELPASGATQITPQTTPETSTVTATP